MRAIWSGAIGFGLVNIPVKLYSAVQDSTLDLHMLDKKDHASIKFQRVNERSGKVVPWANIVKAYDLDGQFVVLEDADYEKAMPEKTKQIEIASFAEETEIDSMLYEAPYYIEPEKQGARAYALLWSALHKSGKVGLGTFVLRTKETICIVKAEKGVMVLQRLRFQEEVRSHSDLNIPSLTATGVKPNELKMAMSLIDQLSEPFDISAWKDTYSEKLMKLIRAKAKGRKVTAPKLKVVHSRSSDLMSQLKASLGSKKKKAS